MTKKSDIEPAESSDNPVAKLNDFSDRLSPIVVKEMRQGLRQASFVILFLFLQSVLAMAVISSLFAVSSGTVSSRMQTGTMISSFFFALFSGAALVIQPLRALNALSSEIKDCTIDLLLLTRLNSWRIVFGKWLSLNTQSALLLVAIIPYLMMRYFLGGMNLISELIALLCIFLVGGAATAAAVGMSAIRSVILRSIFAIGGIIFFAYMLQGLFMLFRFRMMGRSSGLFSIGSGSSNDWIPIICGLVLLVIYLTHSFLEFGATRIAPPSENRSARKRLIAIGALILIPLIISVTDVGRDGMCHAIIAIIVPLALADALSENPHYVRPMKGRDFWMLRPGWPSGALFGLIIVMMTMAWVIILALTDTGHTGYSFGVDQEITQALAVLMMIFCQPVLFIAIFRPHDRDPANVYMASMLGSIALGMVILMVASTLNSGDVLMRTLYIIFPVLGFGTLGDASVTITACMFVVSCIYLVGGAFLGYRKWANISAVAPPTSNESAA